MDQIVQIVGAILILLAFAGSQLDILDQHSYRYLILNLVGSVILAVLALNKQQWGFVLLESVWAAVSLWSLVLLVSGRTPRQSHPQETRPPGSG